MIKLTGTTVQKDGRNILQGISLFEQIGNSNYYKVQEASETNTNTFFLLYVTAEQCTYVPIENKSIYSGYATQFREFRDYSEKDHSFIAVLQDENKCQIMMNDGTCKSYDLIDNADKDYKREGVIRPVMKIIIADDGEYKRGWLYYDSMNKQEISPVRQVQNNNPMPLYLPPSQYLEYDINHSYSYQPYGTLPLCFRVKDDSTKKETVYQRSYLNYIKGQKPKIIKGQIRQDLWSDAIDSIEGTELFFTAKKNGEGMCLLKRGVYIPVSRPFEDIRYNKDQDVFYAKDTDGLWRIYYYKYSVLHPYRGVIGCEQPDFVFIGDYIFEQHEDGTLQISKGENQDNRPVYTGWKRIQWKEPGRQYLLVQTSDGKEEAKAISDIETAETQNMKNIERHMNKDLVKKYNESTKNSLAMNGYAEKSDIQADSGLKDHNNIEDKGIWVDLYIIGSFHKSTSYAEGKFREHLKQSDNNINPFDAPSIPIGMMLPYTDLTVCWVDMDQKKAFFTTNTLSNYQNKNYDYAITDEWSLNDSEIELLKTCQQDSLILIKAYIKRQTFIQDISPKKEGVYQVTYWTTVNFTDDNDSEIKFQSSFFKDIVGLEEIVVCWLDKIHKSVFITKAPLQDYKEGYCKIVYHRELNEEETDLCPDNLMTTFIKINSTIDFNTDFLYKLPQIRSCVTNNNTAPTEEKKENLLGIAWLRKINAVYQITNKDSNLIKAISNNIDLTLLKGIDAAIDRSIDKLFNDNNDINEDDIKALFAKGSKLEKYQQKFQQHIDYYQDVLAKSFEESLPDAYKIPSFGAILQSEVEIYKKNHEKDLYDSVIKAIKSFLEKSNFTALDIPCTWYGKLEKIRTAAKNINEILSKTYPDKTRKWCMRILFNKFDLENLYGKISNQFDRLMPNAHIAPLEITKGNIYALFLTDPYLKDYRKSYKDIKKALEESEVPFDKIIEVFFNYLPFGATLKELISEESSIDKIEDKLIAILLDD